MGLVLVTVRDETPSGRVVSEATFDLPDSVSARDLIRFRVREEVAKHNASPGGSFRGLVRPEGGVESAPGVYTVPLRRIDWEKQADIAIDAFSRNGFLLLVADRQVEDLEEQISLGEAEEISFVRLVPLVGG